MYCLIISSSSQIFIIKPNLILIPHRYSTSLITTFNLLWTVAAYFTIPETKGRSYLELDELFDRKVSARKFRKAETQADLQKKQMRERGQA